MYTKITDWLTDCRQLPENAYDNIMLFTGEEGSWKSKKMRQVGKLLDPTFTVDRIHFTQEAYLEQAVSLEPGQTIVLDEFRGHKRLAMHGVRMEMLDFWKETRDLRLHQCVGFPQAQQLDEAILYGRVRYVLHSPARPLLHIFERSSQQRVGSDGKFVTHSRFKEVGKFPWSEDFPDPMYPAYKLKKDARMKDRAARYREAYGAAPEVPSGKPERRLNWIDHAGFLSEVQAELRRGA